MFPKRPWRPWSTGNILIHGSVEKKPRKQASTWGWTVAVHGSHGTTSWKGSQKYANKWTQVIPHKNYQKKIQNPFYMNACHCRFNSAQGVLKVFSLEHANTICRPLAWAPGPEANIFLPCGFTPPESYLNRFQLLVSFIGENEYPPVN